MQSSQTRRLLLVACCSAMAACLPIPPTAQPDTAKRVVQQFYDWYVPHAAQSLGIDRLMEGAARGPIPMTPELVRWMRIDSTAQARAKGEIDGLDHDPYLKSQDPCRTYTARSVTPTDSSFLVSVHGHGGCPEHSGPDVIVEIAYRNAQWTILEFYRPNRGNEGVIPLLKRLHPTAR